MRITPELLIGLTNSMQKGKLLGGLGFRCFDSLNAGMLMKQKWRVDINPDLLISRSLKQKYFRNTSLLDTKVKQRDSYVWKGIMEVMDIF